MSISDLLFSFDGRITRSKFWGYFVPYNLLFILSAYVHHTAYFHHFFWFLVHQGVLVPYGFLFRTVGDPNFLPFTYLLLTLYPSLAISVKRCHDLGKSGWFVLLGIIPIVNLYYAVEVGFQKGTVGENKYGSDPLFEAWFGSRVTLDGAMSDARCARCDCGILTGQGYAVYAEANTGIAADHRVFISAPGPGAVQPGDVGCTPVDAMLYCDECASALFTDEVWANAEPLRVEMAPEDVTDPEGKKERFEVIDFSIALRMKRLGMTPSQARREARAFGELWWQDQGAARRRLAAGEPAWKEVQRDGKPTASLVLGIVSVAATSGILGAIVGVRPSRSTYIGSLVFGVLTGVPAIFLGHISRSQIMRSQGRLEGKGRALAGLTLGCLGGLSAFLLWVIFLVPGYPR